MDRSDMTLNWEQPYPSRRSPVMAANVVATSQPLAAQAGLEMLRSGGNAVDAALAAAVALVVVEPTSNGLGSDAFAIVCDADGLHGLNASGRSPAAWSPDRFAGLERMPSLGWDAVTVPGVVSAWAELSGRFGRLEFARLFEPALRYAREGWLVPPVIAAAWRRQGPELGERFGEFARIFLPGGRPPRPGQVFACPEAAATLQEIAETRGESFYRGALAARIAAAAAADGGAMTREDLAAHRADWVEPLRVSYRDLEVHEIPPNGQGLVALVALGILGHFDLGRHPVDSPESIHLQIEATKLAFREVYAAVADPEHMTVAPREMLSPGAIAKLAAQIDPARAADIPWSLRSLGDTVYLTAADSDGMMVSFIQSNANGFGSGVVVPGTGISMHNRGVGFSLAENHPNRVAGRKRPFHTIIPGFVTRGGVPLMSFGVMGGPMQPQGHVQMVVRLADGGQNPQAASDAPRWRVQGGNEVLLEAGADLRLASRLSGLGHRVEMTDESGPFGGAQLIHRLEGGYCAGSDHRKDGCAVGF